MKTIKINFIILLFGTFFSFQSYCQPNQIVADAKPFKYLIGKKYSNVSELGNFEFESSSARKNLIGEKNSTTVLVQKNKQIITSEKAVNNKITNTEIYEILDIIVLDGHYSVCGGCFLSKKENNSIVSIHSYGSTNNDSVLVAFERNRRTGKYKQVNPAKLKWNPNKITHPNK